MTYEIELRTGVKKLIHGVTKLAWDGYGMLWLEGTVGTKNTVLFTCQLGDISTVQQVVEVKEKHGKKSN